MKALSTRSSRAATFLFLCALPFVFFWRETLGWFTLGDGDAVFWFFPAYHFVAEQLKQGRLPWWNPYWYGGAPLFAQWQAGVLDPFNWLYLLGVTSRMLTTVQQLSFSLSLGGMYLFMRRLGCLRRAAVFAAVVYALSGFVVGRVIYPGFLHIYALAPLVLWALERLRQRGRWRDAVLGAGFIAWQLCAAHPQPFLYSSLVALAYALFHLRWQRAGFIRANARYVAQVVLVFAGGLSLAAWQMLPVVETARQSVRAAWPYELFTFNSLHPFSLLVTLFPFLHGQGSGWYALPYWGAYWHHHEAQIYVGVVVLALAGAATLVAWRTRWPLARFWSVVAVVGVLLALGGYVPPLARVLYLVPVLGQFRSPNRHWQEVICALAVLSGLALDRLLRADAADLLARVALRLAFGLTAGCALGGGWMWWRRNAAESWLRALPDWQALPAGFLQKAGPELWLPILTACVLTWLLWRCVRAPRLWYGPLLCAVLLDFQLYAFCAPIRNDEAHLERLLGRALPPSLAAQANALAPPRYHLLLNPATGEFNPFWVYGHEFVTGYDPLLNTRYKTFTGIDEAGRSYAPNLLQARDRTLDVLGVRYVLVAPGFFEVSTQVNEAGLGDATRWRAVPNDSPIKWYDRMQVYENLQVLPRAWLVDAARPVNDEYRQLQWLRGELRDEQGRAFDPRTTALVDEADAATAWYRPWLEARREGELGSVRMLAREPGRLALETTATRAALLVLSEMAYPGWQATLDGKPVEWRRVNFMLCGVPVAAGTHRVTFEYRPRSVNVGALVSITTAFVLLLLAGWEWRQRGV